MKKTVSVLLVLAMLATSLCGCGGKKNDKKEDKSQKTDFVTYDEFFGDTDFREKLSLFQYDDFSKYVTIADYKGLEYDASLGEISDAEIDNYVRAILEEKGYGEQKTVTDRPVQTGDTVNIDFVGKKDGVAFEGGTAQGHDLVIGSGSFIDGFESGLVGAKTGEVRDLDLTFPENYGNAELAGKAVVFTVTVNSIKTVVYPALTDEIVAKISECKTVSEYREVVRSLLKEDTDFVILNALFPSILENSTFTALPQKELDFFVDYVAKSYADQYGLSTEDETVLTLAKTEAENYVKYYILYFAIAEAEGLDITDERFKKAFDNAAVANELDAESAKNMNMDIFYMSLVYENAADFVLKNSVAK